MVLFESGFNLIFNNQYKGINLMEYHTYKDTNGQWRWRLLAANNRIIANSGEGYYNESDCLHAINLVKSTSTTPVYKV